jgi:hypothetical protein
MWPVAWTTCRSTRQHRARKRVAGAPRVRPDVGVLGGGLASCEGSRLLRRRGGQCVAWEPECENAKPLMDRIVTQEAFTSKIEL